MEEKTHPGISIGKRPISVLLFADDLVLIFDKEERLQRSLNSVFLVAP
jgi:hypothetical protein